jgi:outer membrane protein OmpA-like peptidoglycan-associated protein
MNAFRTPLAWFAMILISTLARADTMPAADVPGAKDHPLLSRYAGSKISAYQTKDYDGLWLVAGPGDPSQNPPYKKVLRLEGKVTRLAYVYPQERSSLEVMRNFKNALQTAGFRILFACDAESCGAGFDSGFDEKVSSLEFQDMEGKNVVSRGGREARYVIASGALPSGAIVHASVYVAPSAQEHNGGIYIEVVDAAAMESGKVTANLSADQMAKKIATDGKVAIYGVYFDTDRADIKPESKPTLDEMAQLLEKNPKLSVYIVGHTDNQGTFGHNQDLSERRANAVVKALVTGYGVTPGRLVAKGVASLAPVASNSEEPGRAKNRRVEIVGQ